ncbi:MAG: SelB C-terminal domain-containing protein, partial [Actinobacteria bacterium]|nr:SelB C-terminal domain-containing protein [Actinomycetota bacterium]
LSGAPIVEVSAVTGAGIEDLRNTLQSIVQRTPAPDDRSKPRLWIDRVFSMKGAGTVVTGTLTGGCLQQDDDVVVFPSKSRARIRSIQSHNKETPLVTPGNRVALNLVGSGLDASHRGDVIASPGDYRLADHLLVVIRRIDGVGADIFQRGAFKAYFGSSEQDIRLSIIGEYEGMLTASIRLDRSLPLLFGDRFIIREAGRRRTLGGGRVLETRPPQGGGLVLRQAAHARVEVADPAGYLLVLLAEQGSIRKDEVGLLTGLDFDEAMAKDATLLANFLMAPGVYSRATNQITQAVAAHHLTHPLDVGLPKVAARDATGLKADLFDDIITVMREHGEIDVEGGALKIKGFQPEETNPEKERLLTELDSSSPSVPSLDELRSRFGADLIKTLLHRGAIVQISDTLAYSSEWLEETKSKISRRAEDLGPFTVAEFRDLVGTTRKYAVPLLEFFDRTGFTQRDGDLRTVRA